MRMIRLNVCHHNKYKNTSKKVSAVLIIYFDRLKTWKFNSFFLNSRHQNLAENRHNFNELLFFERLFSSLIQVYEFVLRENESELEKNIQTEEWAIIETQAESTPLRMIIIYSLGVIDEVIACRLKHLITKSPADEVILEMRHAMLTPTPTPTLSTRNVAACGYRANIG